MERIFKNKDAAIKHAQAWGAMSIIHSNLSFDAYRESPKYTGQFEKRVYYSGRGAWELDPFESIVATMRR